MPPVEIDDLEFEVLLERIIDLWERRKDTMEMATILGTTEAKTAYVLSCYIEGKYNCREDETVSRGKP